MTKAKKQSVADIVVDRLINKIQNEKRVPWHKPFQSACMNWFSKREYMGINKILLDGGEYITPNQIKQYNEGVKDSRGFWFESGTPSEIVVFYSKYEKKITEQQAKEILKKSYGKYIVMLTPTGWVQISWTLRYYRVYNIRYIREILNPSFKDNPDFKDGIFKKRVVQTKKGERLVLELDPNGDPILKEGVTADDFRKLEPKLGNSIVEEHTPAEEIVEKYVTPTGVGVRESGQGAYYTHTTDSVYLPPKKYFESTEAYYRVLFHELIHSTGITERLNRACFHQYHEGSKERSKEELVAEIGGLLLASEAGFREDTKWADNSLEYVAGWCQWMKDNKSEVLNGMLMAEKAKNYILSGGVNSSGSSDRSIDNPDEPQETDQVDVIEEDENTTPTSSDTSKSPTSKTKTAKTKSEVMTIKSKRDALTYYQDNLVQYFNSALTEDEKKAVLEGIKVVELEHLYRIITKEKLTKRMKKADILTLIEQAVVAMTRIG